MSRSVSGQGGAVTLCAVSAVHLTVLGSSADDVLGYPSTSRRQSVSPVRKTKLSLSKHKPRSHRDDWKQGLHDCTWPSSYIYAPSSRDRCSGACEVFFLLKGPWYIWGGTQGALEAHQGPGNSGKFTTNRNSKFGLWRD